MMKLKTILTVLTIALFLGAGCQSKNTTIPEGDTSEMSKKQQPTNVIPSVTFVTPNAMPSFSQEEITEHASSTDCWVTIQDHVYDATSFIKEYPTESAILMNDCGKDAKISVDGFNEDSRTVFLKNEIGNLE
jgi:cytochrome b involved in lipid metabolism